MTNEVRNVPDLRFPGFEGEWEESNIDNEFDFFNNKRKPIKENLRNKGEYPYYGATGIIDYVDNFIFDGNFILIGEDGANIVSRSAPLVYFATGKFWVNNHAHILYPKFGDIYFNYLLLENIDYEKYNTGTAQPKLNVQNLKKIKIKSPRDNSEQQKIGNFFSKLDRQIELEEQKLEKLEEQKKGYMQKLFSQELRFKDENGNDYPEWMETNIRNTFDNRGGTALEKEFDNNGTHKVISIGSYSMNSTYNEQSLRINKNEFTAKYRLNEGDLAMVLNDKTKEGNIMGRSIYIDEDDKYIYNQRTERLIPVTGNNHKFLWYLMNSEQFRKKIKQMKQRATQVYINYNSMKDLSIYLPILEEQNKIENFLGDIFNIIKNQSDKVELLKRRKKGFLQKMFV